jgi:hypothetical protein
MPRPGLTGGPHRHVRQGRGNRKRARFGRRVFGGPRLCVTEPRIGTTGRLAMVAATRQRAGGRSRSCARSHPAGRAGPP